MKKKEKVRDLKWLLSAHCGGVQLCACIYAV